MKALHSKRKHHILSSENRLGDSLDEDVVVSESEDNEEEEDSSVASILSSLPSEDEADDRNKIDSRYKTKKKSETLEKKWLRLQKVFAERDRMLERLSREKNPRLIALIREREVIVRKQERELLLLNHLETESQEQQRTDGNEEMEEEEQKENLVEKEYTVDNQCEYDDDEDDLVDWYDCRENEYVFPAETAAETATKNGILHRMYDIALFEWFIGLPAVLSLILHNFAHFTIYDLVEIFVELSGNVLHIRSEFSYGLCFLLGLALMRSSGYLYWWLGDNDFNCIKFDMHNRLRLRHWDARYMLWIKRHSFIQALLFMLGYHICYKVAFDCYENFFYLFFHPDSLAALLPESQFRRDFLLLAKSWITWASFRIDIDEEMEYPFSGPLQATLFLMFLTVSFVMILKSFCGFSFFDKY